MHFVVNFALVSQHTRDVKSVRFKDREHTLVRVQEPYEWIENIALKNELNEPFPPISGIGHHQVMSPLMPPVYISFAL